MTMIRWIAALALTGLLAVSMPALADYQVKDATGSTLTIKAVSCGGSVCPQAVPGDANGNTYVPGSISPVVSNPTSTLTRPANTTAYSQNNLIASNTTAGSIVVPSVAIANAAGGAGIPRLRLSTNKTSGWDQVTIQVTLWTAAPTYTNGDGGAYAVATGGAGKIASYDCTLTQYGDAAAGSCTPNAGYTAFVKLVSGTAIYWDMKYTGSGSLTPASGQTFTLTGEFLN